jgi:hypothetical protein
MIILNTVSLNLSVPLLSGVIRSRDASRRLDLSCGHLTEPPQICALQLGKLAGFDLSLDLVI